MLNPALPEIAVPALCGWRKNCKITLATAIQKRLEDTKHHEGTTVTLAIRTKLRPPYLGKVFHDAN